METVAENFSGYLRKKNADLSRSFKVIQVAEICFFLLGLLYSIESSQPYKYGLQIIVKNINFRLKFFSSMLDPYLKSGVFLKRVETRNHGFN